MLMEKGLVSSQTGDALEGGRTGELYKSYEGSAMKPESCIPCDSSFGSLF